MFTPRRQESCAPKGKMQRIVADTSPPLLHSPHERAQRELPPLLVRERASFLAPLCSVGSWSLSQKSHEAQYCALFPCVASTAFFDAKPACLVHRLLHLQ